MFSKNHFFKPYILLLFIISKLSLFTQETTTPLNEDLNLMMQWFEGEFDNFQQTWMEEEDSIALELRHEHIHSIFAKVDMPQIGKHTFFVKQYQDGDTSNIYRQRVYNFHINESEQAIQLDIYSFKTPEEEAKYRNADQQKELLNEMSISDFRNIEGCAVYWKKEGDHFIGYMKEKACHFTSKRSGKEIYITDSLRLSQDEIWIRDEAYDADGNYIFGNKAGIHHKLKRCRYFNGWIAVEKEPKSNDYYLMRNIRLHDQGHKIRLMDKDGAATPYFVELSEVKHRSGIEVLKLAVYEEGNKKSLCYVWTNVEAKRIGINMRTITSGFVLEENSKD